MEMGPAGAPAACGRRHWAAAALIVAALAAVCPGTALAGAPGILRADGTPTADRPPVERYLVGGTWNNLNNQRLSVFRAMVTAAELDLTFVLPHWHINFQDYPPYGVATLAPFDYFYKSEALIEFGKTSGLFKVAKELPHHLVPACFSQLQHTWSTHQRVRTLPNGTVEVMPWDARCPSVTNLTSALVEWSDAYGVACVTTQCTFYLQLHHHDHKFLGFRPGFVVSDLFLNEVNLIMDLLQAKFGTREYISLHARTEEDWLYHCPSAEKTWARDAYCYVSESQISDFLKTRIPAGSLLLVASGDPLEKFPNLCSRFRCWKRDLVKPKLSEGIYDKVTSRAFLDLILSTFGTKFYGNKFSTFSIEVNEEYKTKSAGQAEPGGGALGYVEFYNAPRVMSPEPAPAPSTA